MLLDFIIGLVIGCSVGVFLASLLAAAKTYDDD